MMNIYSRDRHSNLTSRSFDQSRSISANESTYNYGRKREREITFLWKEHSRPFLWDPFVWWTINSRADTREIRYRQLVCRYGISLLPQCFCGGEEEQAAKRAARREPSTVSPTPMEPMEEETSEYTRMGKPILDEVITCVLAAWSGEESERKSLHYVKRGSARFLSKAREASLYHQKKKKKKLVVNWRNIHSRSVGRDEEETIERELEREWIVREVVQNNGALRKKRSLWFNGFVFNREKSVRNWSPLRKNQLPIGVE